MDTIEKLHILADAAKYDASCASSGGERRNSVKGKGMGSSGGSGICHAYTPDGRCISLLKILLTNFCMYECSYCINRNSSDVPRARFSTAEVVKLTLDFYRRNYIEGLFLSSGIIRSADYTMREIVEVARQLREDHDFRGYIHLKTIPDADEELLALAGRYADRLSINVELPTQEALVNLAPEKDSDSIERSMSRIHNKLLESKADRKLWTDKRKPTAQQKRALKQSRFAPAGQSTQMIVGAEPSDDATIIHRAQDLYQNFQLRRVYYSAFSPIPDASKALPPRMPPLQREHRLYQADWLIRFYGFEAQELLPKNSGDAQMLRLDVDPKLDWALRHRDQFPIDINRASKEALLRIPGLGPQSVNKIIQARRQCRLGIDDLLKLRGSVKKSLPFASCRDYIPSEVAESSKLYSRFADASPQMSLL